MRTYRQDSPRAAARIVAMAALADGHLCATEAERFEREVAPALNLADGEWRLVLREYCEDMLVGGGTGWVALRSDAPVIASLLGEIRDPALRRTVLELCERIGEADAYLHEAEIAVMRVAKAHWGLEAARAAAR